MKKDDSIKTRRHFLFLGVIPAILFLTLVIISLSWMREIYIANAVQDDLNAAYRVFYGDLYKEATLINFLAEHLIEIKEIQDGFLAKDRDRLLKAARPIFQKISADYEITHLYFHTLDKTAFLRVHYPDLFGDAINRFTLKDAEKTGSVSYGLELGTMGTLTLRVVVPWLIDGKAAGYLELGKEINNVLHEMKKTLEMDLVMIVNKRHLDKKGWGKGEYGEIDSVSDWDLFPEVVVTGMTTEQLPPIISADLALPHPEHKDILLDINVDGRHYLAGFAPLLDASDKDIGDIIIIKDFTEMKKVVKNITFVVLTGYLFCVLLYIIFILVYLRRIKDQFRQLSS